MSSFSSWKQSLTEALMLREAEQTASNYTAPQQARIAELFHAGALRVEVAEELSDARRLPAAVGLYREGAHLLLRARKCASDATVDASAAQQVSWDEARELFSSREPPPAGLDQALAVLSSSEPLVFDLLDPEEAAARRIAIDETVAWMRRNVEPRSPTQIKRTRWSRIVGSMAVCALLVGVILYKTFEPVNLAYKKPVTSSSRHPVSLAPPDNSGLVNGEIELTYGILTGADNPAWVQVDLQAVYPIKRVLVYGRSDGSQNEGSPMTLEISQDGIKYEEVETCNVPILSKPPWTAKVRGKLARFVRLRTPKYIAITELEVIQK